MCLNFLRGTQPLLKDIGPPVTTSKHHQQSWDQEKIQAEASDKVRELWGTLDPYLVFYFFMALKEVLKYHKGILRLLWLQKQP